MAKLRADLQRTQDALKSEEKEAYDYHEGMIQNQQDMMKYEADAQRLREDRNKDRDKYDEERRNAESATAADASAAVGTSSSSTSKISRKEHEKIVIPAWPKIHDLEAWKSQVVAAVVTASGDERQEDWINCLSDAFQSPMDLDTFESAGEPRFASIDAKLGITLHTIIHAAGERSHDVQLKVRQMMQKRARSEPALEWSKDEKCLLSLWIAFAVQTMLLSCMRRSICSTSDSQVTISFRSSLVNGMKFFRVWTPMICFPTKPFVICCGIR